MSQLLEIPVSEQLSLVVTFHEGHWPTTSPPPEKEEGAATSGGTATIKVGIEVQEAAKRCSGPSR